MRRLKLRFGSASIPHPEKVCACLDQLPEHASGMMTAGKMLISWHCAMTKEQVRPCTSPRSCAVYAATNLAVDGGLRAP